ncbi:MAG TPA: hypothetical protein RMH85_32925 [Polyangiaceae bacterium LLY-WYZ-15_(1-7)]|nr:hypothetical protein [Myxococcales bacterium]MBJ73042.1 hypothetical protein [Sandaracinus sp.]HJL00081.1 hypothetical protein [Polyangiaceae bacterium LLY-WYZ-15_(1-7)]HJL13332.1 hypothetical protein [Polyangiaceae bacterium LLY-WYZ-15_(1-7)]HJL26067.1 hypothetical protein [Polyangiaceae bacterium LLY-WYZ-15_(1-7)]
MPRNVPAFLGPIAAATLAALLGFSERPPVFEGVPDAERYGSFAVASSGDAALDAVVREELEARGYEARSAAEADLIVRHARVGRAAPRPEGAALADLALPDDQAGVFVLVEERESGRTLWLGGMVLEEAVLEEAALEPSAETEPPSAEALRQVLSRLPSLEAEGGGLPRGALARR